MRILRSRQTAIDLAIFAVIILMFFAGVIFEANRSGSTPSVAPGAGAEAAPTATPTNEQVTEPTETPESVPTPAPSATPAPIVRGTPNPAAVGQPVFLDLSGVENESIVEADSVTITGVTTPDALVSVNGIEVPVELDGTFSLELQLEAGPNFIDIVSSNLKGEETRREISVVSVQ